MARLWADHAYVQDRFVLNDTAFVAWCGKEFGIRDRASATQRITEIDPLAEKIVVDGVAYQIPDECYQKIAFEF